jgi:glucokinase
MQYLTIRYGRVSNERVLSGRGLADIFHFLSEEDSFRTLVRPETRGAMSGSPPEVVITEKALAGEDPVCEVALSMFVSILGAVAGNLALLLLTTGGVFVGGGIAPRVLPFLERGSFRDAFEHKGRFRPLVGRIPLFVIVREEPGLLGAAVRAAEL